MKLVLDDIRPAPPGWYRARTAAVAIMHLSGGDVEELSLDHDLDVCVLCEEEAASAEAELRADGVDVDAFLGRLHEAIAAKLKGKPMPKIALFCSSHDRGNGLDVVDWMIRTGVWPRTRPVVHSANESRAAIMRDRIEAYWRPRVDLERAPKFVCAAHYGDDAAEVMGCYTPQEAVASFARGRWRLVGALPRVGRLDGVELPRAPRAAAARVRRPQELRELPALRARVARGDARDARPRWAAAPPSGGSVSRNSNSSKTSNGWPSPEAATNSPETPDGSTCDTTRTR